MHSMYKVDSQAVQGVRGDLSLVADGFRCKQCDRTIQEADLAGDLVVDGETYACVKSFCYLEDIHSSLARDERSSVCQLCQK